MGAEFADAFNKNDAADSPNDKRIEALMTVTTTHHDEHPLDHDAMQAMRAMIAAHPAADLSPDGRPAFDTLMEMTPAADGVAYKSAVLGGVAGWWCRPAGAIAGTAILYLHGGAYVVGSAKAYRHFVGQIAARAGAPAFVPDYALAPERPFPAAIDDAEAAYRALADTGASRLAIVGDWLAAAWRWSSPPAWPRPRARAPCRALSPQWSCRHGRTWR